MSSRWSAFVLAWSSGCRKQEENTASRAKGYDDSHPVRDVLARHVLYTGCSESLALVKRAHDNIEEALAKLNNYPCRREADHPLYMSREFALHVIAQDVIRSENREGVLNWLRMNTVLSEVYTSIVMDAAWAGLTRVIIQSRVRILYDQNDPDLCSENDVVIKGELSDRRASGSWLTMDAVSVRNDIVELWRKGEDGRVRRSGGHV
jgi:hypothetical protein